ncbi:hypothetical protein FA95DRAFT_1139934 [Auriscalpium vulgare]|uniref:Uncharacterized protein n=1 Tax=Auriscalpium vulgare TaxID=40419 RepID=A0ACB8RUT0_9AGAM|nr:hypothetical protein FA95DRAFT_1139934 [Auriscalpium vulgare]
MCAPADVVTFLSAQEGFRHLDIDRTVGCGPLWHEYIYPDGDLNGQAVGDFDGTDVGELDDSDVGDSDGPDYFKALEQHLDCPSDMLPNLETLACFPGQAVDILKPMLAKPPG